MVCGNHELADDGWFLQVCQGKAVLCAIGIQGRKHGCAWRPGHDGKRSLRSGPLQATPTARETSDKRTNTHPGFGKHAGSSCVLGLVGETDGAGVGGCRKGRTAWSGCSDQSRETDRRSYSKMRMTNDNDDDDDGG